MAGRKKIPKRTEEEARLDRYKFELDEFEHRVDFVPEPTISYTVGEQVIMGNLQNVFVIDNVHGGKGVIVEFDSGPLDRARAREKGEDEFWREKRIVQWNRIKKLEGHTDEVFNTNGDIRMNFTMRDLEDLLYKKYHFGLDMEPDYQRGYEWTLEDKQKLIDSIFKNVEIGKFAFIHNGYKHDSPYLYQILDGKQRLNAILEFYENRFTYNGLYFYQLSLRDQHWFERYPITVAEAQDLTREQILRYFLNLNTGGRQISMEHLAKVALMLEEEMKKGA